MITLILPKIQMGRIRIIATVFLLIIFQAAAAQKPVVLSAVEFQQKTILPTIQLLDVRTMDEYKAGHIKNSFQADWLNEKEFRERISHLDKNIPVLVYCASGPRSSAAAVWLAQNGFREVYELRNGFIGWQKDERPVETIVNIPQLTLAQFKEQLKRDGFVVVDFGASWCPPCKKFEPVVQKLAADLPEGNLIRIDAGVHTKLVNQLKVEKLPTLLVYKNGKEIARKEGFVEYEELKSLLN